MTIRYGVILVIKRDKLPALKSYIFAVAMTIIHGVLFNVKRDSFSLSNISNIDGIKHVKQIARLNKYKTH